MLSTDIFRVYASPGGSGKVHPGAGGDLDITVTAGTQTIDNVLQGETIETANTGLRNGLSKISVKQITDLNSTIYFSRTTPNDFN